MTKWVISVLATFVLFPLAVVAADDFAASGFDVQLVKQKTKAKVSKLKRKPQRRKSIVLGHNLSPTSNTLAKGDVTVGSMIVGVGITDNILLATSPFLYMGYNMHNVFVRTKKRLDKTWDWGTQNAYFKTADLYDGAYYQMEAMSHWSTFTSRVSRSYTNHININYMYFFDETIPFSLRQEPMRDHPYQFTVTNLMEVKLTDSTGAMLEAGYLGIDYQSPAPHVGASLFFRTRSWYFQGGFSQTVLRDNHPSTGERPQFSSRLSVHPEIVVQGTF